MVDTSVNTAASIAESMSPLKRLKMLWFIFWVSLMLVVIGSLAFLERLNSVKNYLAEKLG